MTPDQLDRITSALERIADAQERIADDAERSGQAIRDDIISRRPLAVIGQTPASML